MRNKIPKEKMRKKVSLTIDPKVYEIYKKYCEKNNIENYSEHIEKIILKMIDKK